MQAFVIKCDLCKKESLIFGSFEFNEIVHCCGEYSEVLDCQLLEETDEYHFDFTGNIPDVAQALYCEIRDFLNSKK